MAQLHKSKDIPETHTKIDRVRLQYIQRAIERYSSEFSAIIDPKKSKLSTRDREVIVSYMDA